MYIDQQIFVHKHIIFFSDFDLVNFWESKQVPLVYHTVVLELYYMGNFLCEPDVAGGPPGDDGQLVILDMIAVLPER